MRNSILKYNTATNFIIMLETLFIFLSYCATLPKRKKKKEKVVLNFKNGIEIPKLQFLLLLK